VALRCGTFNLLEAHTMIQHPKYRHIYANLHSVMVKEDGASSYTPAIQSVSSNGKPAVRVGKALVRETVRVIAECMLGRVLQNHEQVIFANGVYGDFREGNASVVKLNSQMIVGKRAKQYAVPVPNRV
jgi:hypothetical protein